MFAKRKSHGNDDNSQLHQVKTIAVVSHSAGYEYIRQRSNYNSKSCKQKKKSAFENFSLTRNHIMAGSSRSTTIPWTLFLPA